MNELRPVICMRCTCIRLSTAPVQVACCSTNEAHVLQTQAAEGLDGELGSSPNGHGKSDLVGPVKCWSSYSGEWSYIALCHPALAQAKKRAADDRSNTQMIQRR